MKQTQRHASRIMQVRRGFTSLEFMVALVVLGVALAGVFPLMIVCSRGIESLELRYTAEGNKNGNWFSPIFRPNVTGAGIIPREDYGTWYVIPSADPWASKLGAVATFSRTAPANAPWTRIIDDSDAGYASTGGWANTADVNALRGEYQRHGLQSPATDTAAWTFSNVGSGYYYVLATWPALSDLATNARYEIYDGATLKATVDNADQTASPGDASSVYQGRPWRLLTMQKFTSADKKVKVTLYSNTEKAVAADAVRIAPVAMIRSVDKSFNTEEVTVRVKVGP